MNPDGSADPRVIHAANPILNKNQYKFGVNIWMTNVNMEELTLPTPSRHTRRKSGRKRNSSTASHSTSLINADAKANISKGGLILTEIENQYRERERCLSLSTSRGIGDDILRENDVDVHVGKGGERVQSEMADRAYVGSDNRRGTSDTSVISTKKRRKNKEIDVKRESLDIDMACSSTCCSTCISGDSEERGVYESDKRSEEGQKRDKVPGMYWFVLDPKYMYATSDSKSNPLSELDSLAQKTEISVEKCAESTTIECVHIADLNDSEVVVVDSNYNSSFQ